MNEHENLASAPAGVDAAAEIPAPAVSPMAAAIDAALAMLEDPTLTRIGSLRARLQRAREIPVHPSRQSEVAAVLEEFTRLGVDALRTDIQNTFARLPNLTRKFQALSQPPPAPDERERIVPHLRAAGWSSGEIDLLAHMLKPGELMASCDASAVRLDTRTLTRRAIRDGGRPRWFASAPGWNQQAWENQFSDGVPIPGERRV
ncbi:MAG TPA: hypothetical protein VNF29_14005 [Candidatus Binataceae bacterium]|nr:hypothetical protein [Candidatus Binataceae bacterium]